MAAKNASTYISVTMTDSGEISTAFSKSIKVYSQVIAPEMAKLAPKTFMLPFPVVDRYRNCMRTVFFELRMVPRFVFGISVTYVMVTEI